MEEEMVEKEEKNEKAGDKQEVDGKEGDRRMS
jgi:hypothetical protein